LQDQSTLCYHILVRSSDEHDSNCLLKGKATNNGRGQVKKDERYQERLNLFLGIYHRLCTALQLDPELCYQAKACCAIEKQGQHKQK